MVSLISSVPAFGSNFLISDIKLRVISNTLDSPSDEFLEAVILLLITLMKFVFAR